MTGRVSDDETAGAVDTVELHAALADDFAAIVEPDYSDDDAWLRRCQGDMGMSAPSVFYVHPTTERTLEHWFADPTAAHTSNESDTVVREHTLAFPGILWAPRYRQATTRAFYQAGSGGRCAYDFAFDDVARAFDSFLNEAPAGPIVLAGHSQGARHIVELLRRAALRDPGPLAERLVAAYAIGIGPVRDHHVLAHFAPPKAPEQTAATISFSVALDGDAEASDHPVATPCVDPITLCIAKEDEPGIHLGGMQPPYDDMRVRVTRHGDTVLIEQTEGPALREKALPGGNLHAVEVQLFAKNLSSDVRRRTAAWHRAQERTTP